VSESTRIELTGEQAAAAAAMLRERLTELGCTASVDGNAVVLQGVAKSGDLEAIAVSPHDTPEFAADKIIDRLAELGMVDLESGEYTAAEEEQVRERLADLGYIE
jgi:hypothetical protein